MSSSSKDPVTLINHGQTGLRGNHPRELANNLGSEDAFLSAEFVLKHGKLCKPGDMKTSNKDFFSKDYAVYYIFKCGLICK